MLGLVLILQIFLLVFSVVVTVNTALVSADRPNIVVILADDYGVGDIQAHYPDNPSPYLDRFVQQSISFTDAHSPSAVCSPTRYGLLTGRYAWRTRLQEWVIAAYEPPLIAEDRPTLPGLLRRVPGMTVVQSGDAGGVTSVFTRGTNSNQTLVLFDGNPFHPGPEALWDLAEEERVTVFGTSAKYLDACKKAGLHPARSHDLSALKSLCSTGSPLAPESFDWVYEKVKGDLMLASIAGGTDIVSCFMLGCPTQPVWRGEIQVRGLGMAVEVFDERGLPLFGKPGELVCTRPAPSMPLGFWGDEDGSRYRAAYFERYPGVWHHGDLLEVTGRGGVIMHGRSDATLNPGGVRIGTAEIYRQVEQIDEVEEAVVVGQDWDGDQRVVLFLRLRPGLVLDEELQKRVKRQIRANTTPRHVPAVIAQVDDIPRTRSGKISELAVRDVIHGREVANTEALANPEALALFRPWRESR